MNHKNNISLIGKECTGCGLCTEICPVGCLHMELNDEGFWFPQVNEVKCIHCGVCARSCPSQCHIELNKPTSVFAAASYDEEGSRLSSSGGVFYEAARYVIQELQGYVCGAALDENLQLKHIVTNSMNDVERMQGSKYIQSDICACYRTIKSYILQHKKVLFCGTPCQVAGVKRFVGDADSLLTMDLVCHGTPSAAVFSEYMHTRYPEDRYIKFSFRQKNKHIKSLFAYQYFAIREKDKTMKGKCIRSDRDLFYYAFLKGYNYRESCYLCQYAQSSRCGDITIGDCANYRAYDLPINRELSTLCINTETGEKLWRAISKRFCYEEANYEMESRLNMQLHSPAKRPSQRNEFYRDLSELPWDVLQKKYCPSKSIKAEIKDFFIWHTTPKTREKIKCFFRPNTVKQKR